METTFPGVLIDWWYAAGGHWTEDDLARRNDGAVSPALYPAVDPDAHYDVEHKAVHELDGTALPPPDLQAEVDEDEQDGQDDQSPNILECFDKNELFLANDELTHLQSEVYTDLLDQPVTSVWDRDYPKQGQSSASRSISGTTSYRCVPKHCSPV